MFKSLIEKIAPSFLLDCYHYLLAILSAFWYRFPSYQKQGLFGKLTRKLIVIGVTGTKGKSTTAILAGKILEEGGSRVAWLTSATIKINEKEQLNPYHMTMPGRFAIQRFLRKAVKEGCKYAILEVTSEGIKQYRHKFINFDTAVFTNLKPEHIEAHGGFENYKKSKGKLFQATKNIHVINVDDENAKYFLQFAAKNKWGYRIENSGSAVQDFSTTLVPTFKIISALYNQKQGGNTEFFIGNTLFYLKLPGMFNVYNALAAICVAKAYGIHLEICKKALEKITTMPGRMEIVIEKPFKAIVDLAHTPDSYEEVFKAIKEMPHNKIISVFGSAGGGRDRWKRPVLGKIAAENSDIIILTNEDPYGENPLSILAEIESGFSQIPKSKLKMTKYEKILDRREAIKKALEMGEENDIVLVLGKGTEQLMMIADKKISWDDRKVVREEFNKLNK